MFVSEKISKIPPFPPSHTSKAGIFPFELFVIVERTMGVVGHQMPVSLNIISRSLPLQKCWFSNVLFSHPLNTRIVKSMVLVLKWEGKKRQTSKFEECCWPGIAWCLRIAEKSYFGCVCYFLDPWCVKKAEYMRCISAQPYSREGTVAGLCSVSWQKRKKNGGFSSVSEEKLWSPNPLSLLAGVSKNFSAFACRFCCFHWQSS